MDHDTKENLVANFRANIARVESLTAASDALGSPGVGRPTVHQTDILRAAVVLLHASLEDVLRSSSEHLLPYASKAVLDDIGFPDAATGEKSSLESPVVDVHRSSGIVFATVTSSTFESMDEARRQVLVWSALRSKLAAAEIVAIEFVFTIAPSEQVEEAS